MDCSVICIKLVGKTFFFTFKKGMKCGLATCWYYENFNYCANPGFLQFFLFIHTYTNFISSFLQLVVVLSTMIHFFLWLTFSFFLFSFFLVFLPFPTISIDSRKIAKATTQALPPLTEGDEHSIVVKFNHCMLETQIPVDNEAFIKAPTEYRALKGMADFDYEGQIYVYSPTYETLKCEGLMYLCCCLPGLPVPGGCCCEPLYNNFRKVHMCIYIYTYIHIYIHTYIYIYTYIHIYI